MGVDVGAGSDENFSFIPVDEIRSISDGDINVSSPVSIADFD